MAYTDSDGTQIHYELHGSGEHTVVLIPGLGLPGTAWGPVVAELEADARVVVHEPRGSGLSAPGTGPITPEVVVSDLAATLDEVEAQRVHLVGFSMGGLIAQDFVLRHPERVASLMLLATYAAPDEWLTRVLSLRAEMITKLGMVDHFRVFLLFVFSPLAFRSIPDQIAAVQQRMQNDPPDQGAYLRQIEYCLAHDVTAELAAVQVPAVVMGGSHDLLTSPPLCKELAEAIPGARYECVTDASHGLWLEETVMFATACRDLIDKSSLPIGS